MPDLGQVLNICWASNQAVGASEAKIKTQPWNRVWGGVSTCGPPLLQVPPPQGLTCIRGAWESALLLHRQVAEGRRNGPCGSSGNVLGGNMGLAEGKWGIRDKGLYL